MSHPKHKPANSFQEFFKGIPRAPYKEPMTFGEEGVDHINISFKSIFNAGRFMSIYHHARFNHPYLGTFNNVAGLMYWLSDVNHNEEFRKFSVSNIRSVPTALRSRRPKNIKAIVGYCTWLKIKGNNKILTEIRNLPDNLEVLSYYYKPGVSVRFMSDEADLICDVVKHIIKEVKAKREPDFSSFVEVEVPKENHYVLIEGATIPTPKPQRKSKKVIKDSIPSVDKSDSEIVRKKRMDESKTRKFKKYSKLRLKGFISKLESIYISGGEIDSGRIYTFLEKRNVDLPTIQSVIESTVIDKLIGRELFAIIAEVFSIKNTSVSVDEGKVYRSLDVCRALMDSSISYIRKMLHLGTMPNMSEFKEYYLTTPFSKNEVISMIREKVANDLVEGVLSLCIGAMDELEGDPRKDALESKEYEGGFYYLGTVPTTIFRNIFTSNEKDGSTFVRFTGPNDPDYEVMKEETDLCMAERAHLVVNMFPTGSESKTEDDATVGQTAYTSQLSSYILPRSMVEPLGTDISDPTEEEPTTEE